MLHDLLFHHQAGADADDSAYWARVVRDRRKKADLKVPRIAVGKGRLVARFRSVAVATVAVHPVVTVNARSVTSSVTGKGDGRVVNMLDEFERVEKRVRNLKSMVDSYEVNVLDEFARMEESVRDLKDMVDLYEILLAA